MEPRERNALLLLLGLGIAGHGVRLLSPRSDGPPGALAGLAEAPASDLDRHRAAGARLARPLGTGERVDLNRASAQEISRLPRVGPSLARAIVRARDEAGGFVSLADVDRVPGVGPVLLRSIDSLVTLGDTIRAQARRPAAGRAGRGRNRAPSPASTPPVRVIDRRNLPVVLVAPRGGPSELAPIDLNSASLEQLTTLKGIGPARAKAIVAYRQGNGPFASVQDLEKVPGLSRRLVRQLAPQVTVR
jgi:competence ComEA-like helix-hairpin-helix protein